MVKVGLIGYGSMGRMLVRALIMSGALTPDEIIVSTRTKSKLDTLKHQSGKNRQRGGHRICDRVDELHAGIYCKI